MAMDANSLKAAAQNAPAQTTAVQTQVKKELKPAERVKGLLDKYVGEFRTALPKGWDEKRFVRIAMTSISSNPKLMQACAMSPMTFIGAMMNAAQLGLEPNTSLGKAYILPYNNIDKNTGQKVMQVQFQIGVYGYIDLAYRSGLVESIQAEVRYEKDFWEYERGLNEKLRHVPYDLGDPGEAVGYYAIVKMKNGAYATCYMPKFRVLEHAKRFSKSYNRKTGKFSGPWETDFDAMARKTVLLQALKYVPKASEDTQFGQAFSVDSTVREGVASEMVKTEGVFAPESVSGAPYDDSSAESTADEGEAAPTSELKL